MAKGISLHVGVNDTNAPSINVPALEGSENDAVDMRDLAHSRGFTTQLLLGVAATFDKVRTEILKAAQELNNGDIFLFTFSGHGTRRGADDQTETDLKDETIVLADKLMVDNVLRRSCWPKFKAGVRVVMVADSCHSGTVAMAMPGNFEGGVEEQVNKCSARREFGIRSIPENLAELHFAALPSFYNGIRASLPAGAEAPAIAARVLLLAACKDEETTLDGFPNGVYTKALLDVWSSNGSKTYAQLSQAIAAEVLSTGNHPTMMTVGQSPEFGDTEAFKI